LTTRLPSSSARIARPRADRGRPGGGCPRRRGSRAPRRSTGRPDYVGETTYYWDAEQKHVAFLYIENLGGVSRGTMEPVANGLVFPPTRYVAGNEAMTYRVRWTRQGDDAYEAFSEMQGKDGWTTMFKLLLKRTPS
jgi:hypothetical protein